MHTKKNITSGFTLIEVLVSMTIFTMLIIAFYSGVNNSFQHRTDIRSEITSIQRLYENARNMAISSSSTEASDGTSVVSQYGYGVYADFSETEPKFTLFADNNPQDTDDDGVTDTYGNGVFDTSDDTKISEYTAFTRGISKKIIPSVILFHNTGDTTKNKNISKSDSNKIFTVLFAPLNAQPTVILDNNSDLEFKKYKAFTLNFFAKNLIEEELNFDNIARFFDRKRVCPASGASPENCSTQSTL